jgi:hypothetical protein
MLILLWIQKAYEFTKQSKRNDALGVNNEILPRERSKGHGNINRTNLDTIYTHIAPLHYSLSSRSYQNLHSRLSLSSMTASNAHSSLNCSKMYTHYTLYLNNIHFWTSIQMYFQSKLLLGLSKGAVTKYLYVLFHPCMLQSHPNSF